MRPVGIAKASFYLFFESKEELYIDTVKAEIPQMMERLLDASFRKTDDTRDAIVLMLKAIVHEIETNPLVSIILGYPMDFERLTASLDVTALLRDAQVMFEPLLAEFRKAQKAGKIIPGDPYELLAATGVIKVYPMYRKRVPEPWYSRMLDRTAQLIASGLTSPATAKRRSAAKMAQPPAARKAPQPLAAPMAEPAPRRTAPRGRRPRNE